MPFVAGGSIVAPTMLAVHSFAEDANSTPWYGNATYTSGEYDPVNDTIVQSYEGWNGDERNGMVRMWTNVSTTPVAGRVQRMYAKSSLNNDSHGCPGITRNPADHRWWGLGGQHSNFGDTRVRVSGPNDITTWTALPDITSMGNIGYCKPIFSPATANKMYVFMRKDEDTPNNRRYGAVVIGTVSGASVTFGTLFKFADFGDATRCYIGKMQAVGNDIHFTLTRTNLADSFRRDVYYLILDTTDDSIKNFDKSVSVAAATWQAAPINLATLNASYRVVDIGSNFGVIGSMQVQNGESHIVYKSDAGSAQGSMFYTKATLGVNSWSAPLALGTGYIGSTDYMLGPDVSNGVQLVYRDVQNQIVRRRRTSAGVWGAAAIIARPRPGEQLDCPNFVRGLPWFTFGYTDDNETVEGAYQLFLHNGTSIVSGSGGVRATIDQLFSGLTKPDATRLAAYSAFIETGIADGWWENIKAFWFLDQTGAELRNWKNGSFDLEELGTGSGFTAGALGWDGNGTNRYLQSSLVFNAEMTRTATALGLAASGGSHGVGATARIGCTNTSTAMLALASATGPVIQLSASNAFSGTDTALDGIFQGKRVGTTYTVYGANGLPAGTGAATDTASGAVNFVIGQAKGAGFSTATIYAAYIGHDLSDAMMLSLRNALRTLINTLAPGTIA